MLGQHVYIEADNGQSTKKKGIWLDASFIVSDDNGNSYVWVSERGKLKKRKVELGKSDEETYTTKSNQDSTLMTISRGLMILIQKE